MAHATDSKSDRRLAIAILLLVSVYGILVSIGTFDRGHQSDHESGAQQQTTDSNHHNDAGHETEPAHPGDESKTPGILTVIPFILLLCAIALFPLLKWTERWWESNLNRFYLAAGLAGVTLGYYFFRGGFEEILHVLDHSIVHEYVPFIVLLFSLYTISGGIRIKGDVAAYPSTNCVFLAFGGGLASFIGTTGAAMLLIRPLIETNNERKHVQHTVVFFIFVVCNCGGCLLPIGDPPLFLGYLKGVRFLWTMDALWQPWLVVNALLIGMYYLLDRFYYYRLEKKHDLQRDETQVRPIKISGLNPNLFLLLGVIFGVAFLDPNKPIAFLNDWRPWPFLREIVQISLVAGSLLLGSHAIRAANKFNYHAILEVAVLFIGIFICMQPALAILDEKGPQLPINKPSEFFWATGGLSAVLDNAPTYVVFFETANSKFLATKPPQDASFVNAVDVHASTERQWLIGISLGAVFLGAMTYIGNGPNFMVRAIAEQMGVPMPSFFGYVIRYSLIFLLPVFWLTTKLFL